MNKLTLLICSWLLCCTGSLAQAVVFSGAMDNRSGLPFIPGLTAQSRSWVAGGDPAGGVRLEWLVDDESNPPFWTYSYRLVRGAARNKGFAFFDIETGGDFTAGNLKARQVVAATDASGAAIPAGLAAITVSDPVDFNAVHDFSHAPLSEADPVTVLSKTELSHYSGDPGRAAPGQAGGNSSATVSSGPVPHPFRGIRVTFPGSFATLANLGYDTSAWEFRVVADRVPMWGDVFAWGDQTTLSPYWYSNFYNDHIDDSARLALAPADSLTGTDPYRGWVLVPGPLPSVIATTPSANAGAVPVTEAVSAVFGGIMDPATITAVTFSLSKGAIPVAGVVGYDVGSKTASFTPAAPLVPGTSYTATITGARDLAGNVLPGTVWDFTTALEDVIPPAVVASVPGNGALFVATSTPLAASFSERMLPAAINTTTFTVAGPPGPLDGTVSYSAATRTATFTPSLPLANNASYTATLGVGVTDLAGNHLAEPVSWSITTIPRETLFPLVTATVPAARSINVAVDTPITASFSEDIDPATLNAASFSVAGVTGTVSYDGATWTATFTPDITLAFSTTYKPVITTAVKDRAGNPLPLSVPFSFTTAAPDHTAPTVTAVTPFDGLTNVPFGSSISASFSERIDPLSIGAGSFTVTGQTFATAAPFVVAGAVTLTGGSFTLPSATFTPDAPLLPGTLYTATLSTGVRDLAGNHLAVPRTWSFSTVPDGILIPGEASASIADALRALRIAVRLQPATRDDKNHGDVAPLGPDGRPRPDGSIDISDALVILRMAVGLISF